MVKGATIPPVTQNPEIRLIATTTHGRVLVRHSGEGAVRGVLLGFHGYKENARMQMERLDSIPGAAAWTCVSVQGLHRFYKGPPEEVVASWMTREDREAAIADNIAYVDAVIASLAPARGAPVVFAGFSQGVPMAYRAALRGQAGAAGVIAVGGEVAPELFDDPALSFPPVLLARGARDSWFTQEKFDADLNALRERGVKVTPLVFDGGHEWSEAASLAAGELLAEIAATPTSGSKTEGVGG